MPIIVIWGSSLSCFVIFVFGVVKEKSLRLQLYSP